MSGYSEVSIIANHSLLSPLLLKNRTFKLPIRNYWFSYMFDGEPIKDQLFSYIFYRELIKNQWFSCIYDKEPIKNHRFSYIFDREPSKISGFLMVLLEITEKNNVKYYI